MNSVLILAGLSIVAGVILLFRYFGSRRRNRKVGSKPELANEVHNRFIAIISLQHPDLFGKIDGKFLTTQTGNGQIIPYFFGQDLTDEELQKVMQVFNSAYHEVAR